MNTILKRAAVSAALSILAAILVNAQTKIQKSETHKDIIEKAYNLSLQKDRRQALNILANALRKETNQQNINELKKTAIEISNTFLSDKTQQMYETGFSLLKTDLPGALEKIQDALRLEPDNSVIINQLARILIVKNDCKSSQELIQKQLLVVSFDEDLKLSLAQALICQAKWSEYQRVHDSVPVKKNVNKKFWGVLEIEKFLAIKNFNKANEVLNNLKKTNEKYPELIYWAWKIGYLQKKKSDFDLANSYVITCKNISSSQYRQYMVDPMLCRRTSEVETDTKGTNGSS